MRVFSMLTLFLVACNTAATRTEDDEALRLGLSQKDVSEKFKGSGTHQFSARQGSNAFHCVSYSFGERLIRYYFLFKNDQLVSILDTRPFFANAFTSKPYPKVPGTRIEVRKPWKAEDFMRGILEAKTLSPKAFSSQIKARLEENSGRKRSYNVLPAFLILAPLIIPHAIAENKKYEAWLRAYDPFKIKIGTTRGKVETAYGKPHFIVQHNGSDRETHAYGPSELLRRDKTRLYLGPWNKRFWISVVYENDVAVRVFSNDLFNDMTIVDFKNEVK